MITRTLAGMTLAAGGLWAADLNRGLELYRSAKFGDAEREFAEAARENPGDAHALVYLGLTRLHLNKTAEAASALNEARGIAPDSGEVQVGMARLYIEQGKFGDAETALREAKGQGETSELLLAQGMLRLAQKDFNGAADSLEAALKENPDTAYAHYYAGLAYNGLRQPDRMVNHFQSFLRMAPTAPEGKRVESLLRSVR
jgi:tetratricopeptide (TPR) repeat protein